MSTNTWLGNTAYKGGAGGASTVLTWLGHSAFRLESAGLSILVDPFFVDPAMASLAERDGVDLVLVTHDHADHVGDAVGICRRTGATLAAVVETAARLGSAGVPEGKAVGFNIGGTIEFRGARITMTQAHHSSATGVPVGYVVVMPGGLTVYHAGDTGIFGGMSLLGKLFDIDVALLPVGGHYTMDAEQAAMACGLLKCANVIPMHWGTFPVLAQDTKEFERLVTDRLILTTRCLPMTPGESAEFSS